MIILESLEIENYRNLKKTKLRDLKDLNILIGPNNCGKTNILKAIELINKLEIGPGVGYRNEDACSKINSIWNSNPNNIKKFQLSGFQYASNKNESYLRENNFEIRYTFDENELTRKLQKIDPRLSVFSIAEELSKALREINVSLSPRANKTPMNEHLDDIGFGFSSLKTKITKSNHLILKQYNESWVNAAHISLFSIKKLAEDIQKNIVYIDDSRLQKYRNATITEYIRSKNLRGKEINKLLDFLKSIIDPRIIDYKQSTLELVKDNKFVTSIDEQGSGVRSLICLSADILSSENESIILIDEPELGLNPAAKQAFLKFLLKEAESKQIFITTHDPAFVNPIILAKNAAIFSYSPIYDGLMVTTEGVKEPYEPNFVKIDLDQNPYTFGGYLPHSESLKQIHIYVEGHNDVKKLQSLLSEYFKGKEDELNKFGIYHLGGSFWKHLLYTIPVRPYRSIVILDADKSKEAERVCNEYGSKKTTLSTFGFCKTLKQIQLNLENDIDEVNGDISIYCLDKGCVEDLKSIEEENLKEIVDMLTQHQT